MNVGYCSKWNLFEYSNVHFLPILGKIKVHFACDILKWLCGLKSWWMSKLSRKIPGNFYCETLIIKLRCCARLYIRYHRRMHQPFVKIECAVYVIICDMIKGNESDVGNIDFELQATRDDKFLCCTLFWATKNSSYLCIHMSSWDGVWIKM